MIRSTAGPEAHQLRALRSTLPSLFYPQMCSYSLTLEAIQRLSEAQRTNLSLGRLTIAAAAAAADPPPHQHTSLASISVHVPAKLFRASRVVHQQNKVEPLGGNPGRAAAGEPRGRFWRGRTLDLRLRPCPASAGDAVLGEGRPRVVQEGAAAAPGVRIDWHCLRVCWLVAETPTCCVWYCGRFFPATPWRIGRLMQAANEIYIYQHYLPGLVHHCRVSHPL